MIDDVRAAIRRVPGGHLLARLLLPRRHSAIALRVAIMVAGALYAF